MTMKGCQEKLTGHFLQKAEIQRLAAEKQKAEKEIKDMFDPNNMTSNYREHEVEDINAAEEDFM